MTFVGTTGGTVAGLASYDAMLAFVKRRFAPDSAERGASLEWLQNLDPDDAAIHLAGWVARAFDRRSSEPALVNLDRQEKEIRATYDVGADRYEIRVDDTAYRITRVERPASSPDRI